MELHIYLYILFNTVENRLRLIIIAKWTSIQQAERFEVTKYHLVFQSMTCKSEWDVCLLTLYRNKRWNDRRKSLIYSSDNFLWVKCSMPGTVIDTRNSLREVIPAIKIWNYQGNNNLKILITIVICDKEEEWVFWGGGCNEEGTLWRRRRESHRKYRERWHLEDNRGGTGEEGRYIMQNKQRMSRPWSRNETDASEALKP